MDTSHNGNGLRQRKKEQVRARLIEAAFTLLYERGYEHTTIDDIAAAIDVSPRTFFRYFERKQDVFVARPLVAGGMRRFAETAPAELSALEIARNAVRAVAAYRQSLPGGFREAKMLVETPALADRTVQLRAEWTRDLAAGLANRVGGADAALRAGVIAASAVWVFGVAFEHWIVEDGARPLPEVLETAFAISDDAHVALARSTAEFASRRG